MNIGIIIYSNDSETVWNALRYGNYCIAMDDEVEMFLIGKGVEIESIEKGIFDVKKQLQPFINNGGKIFACGTCLETRHLKISQKHKVSTLEDLHRIVKESERVLTF